MSLRRHSFDEQLQHKLAEAEDVFRREQAQATERFFATQRQLLSAGSLQEAPRGVPRGRHDDTPAYAQLPLIPQPEKRSQVPSKPSARQHEYVKAKEVEEDLLLSDTETETETSILDTVPYVSERSSSKLIKPRSETQKKLLDFIHLVNFELTVSVFVILYCMLIGLWVHMNMTKALDTDPCIHPWIEPIVKPIMVVFFFIFCIEAALRIGAEQRDFFRGPNKYWNAFDIALLVINAVDLTSSDKEEGPLNFLNRLRVLRVFRIARSIRALNHFAIFTELRVMLWSCAACVESFIWAMLLFSSFIFITATFLEDQAVISLKQMSFEDEKSQALADHRKALVENWDGMYSGSKSLVFAVFGGDDWASIGASLFDLSPWMGISYSTFVIVSTVLVLNVLVGIFVQKTGQIGDWDRELALESANADHQSASNTYNMLFDEIDANDSGHIDVEEIKTRLSDQRVIGLFRHLDIDMDSMADDILTALDQNGDGHLSREEFIEGCRMLKGVAKPAKVHIILRKVEDMNFKLDTLIHGPGSPRKSSPRFASERALSSLLQS